MAAITNPNPLYAFFRAALTTRCVICMIGDSDIYTYGGMQQGLAIAAKSRAPIWAYHSMDGPNSQIVWSNPCSPGFSTSDYFGPLGALAGGTASATAAQLVICSSDGFKGPTSWGHGETITGVDNLGNQEFSGMDMTQTLTGHLWQLTGDNDTTGTVSVAMRINNSTLISDKPTVTSGFIFINSATGSANRVHYSNLQATSASVVSGRNQNTLTSIWFGTGYSSKVGPLCIVGTAMEAASVTNGFALSTMSAFGGNPSSTIVRSMWSHQATQKEYLNQLTDLSGNATTSGNTPVLFIIEEGLNDRNATVEASAKYYGLVQSSTNSTVVIDQTGGTDISAAGTQGFTVASATAPDVTSLQAIAAGAYTYTPGLTSGTVTLNSGSWTRNPAAGDPWTAGPITQTQQGFQANISAIITMIQGFCNSVGGIVPYFLVLPAWQPSSTPDANITSYYTAAANLASGNVTAVNTDNAMPHSQLTACAEADGIHIGGYAMSVLLSRVFL